jgi:hypothetical protein
MENHKNMCATYGTAIKINQKHSEFSENKEQTFIFPFYG